MNDYPSIDTTFTFSLTIALLLLILSKSGVQWATIAYNNVYSKKAVGIQAYILLNTIIGALSKERSLDKPENL